MSNSTQTDVKAICERFGNDRTRMMDIVEAVQRAAGCVDPDAIDAIAEATGVPRVEVESVVTFYSFLSETPKGKVVIRLCNDVIDRLQGVEGVAEAFMEELGIGMGETTPDGTVTLEWTPCIGLSDQAPAALIQDVPVTNLDGEKAREIARTLKTNEAVVEKLRRGDGSALVKCVGDGHNADPLVHAMVVNHIRLKGPVIFDAFTPGAGLNKALSMSPAEVIRDVKTSRLRGRGGAGFPTGMKWDFTRQAPGEKRYVLCNADEGEPGTFKDRVILTECPDLLFEGMTIGGYAIGAKEGILYLRGEYAYLRDYLEDVLQKRRENNLLGKNILGKEGVDFDIRIQLGAGAYVCGEETALISSCEGRRGDPKNRPPFPAQKGYLGCPSTINNVETFCCVARILDRGAGWFASVGSRGSSGTKLLSVSGDCTLPGVFEVPFGITVSELLEMAGARDAAAVQIGGPSGRMVGPDQFNRTICYDDLATGGSVMIFGPDRNVVEIAREFMRFFVEESCGYCTPCRVGNVLLESKLNDILAGRGETEDLDGLKALAETVKLTSRCGLGQTAPNPVLSTLENFRSAYETLLKPKPEDDVLLASFDIQKALEEATRLQGRPSVLFNTESETHPITQ